MRIRWSEKNGDTRSTSATIRHRKLPTMLEALRDSKIDRQHLVVILQTNRTVTTIGHGKLPDVMEAPRDSKIDSQHWVGILKTDIAVVVIGHGKLSDIMEALRDSKIDSEFWVGILQTVGDDPEIRYHGENDFRGDRHSMVNCR